MNKFRLWDYSALLTSIHAGEVTLSARVSTGDGGQPVGSDHAQAKLQELIMFARELEMTDCADNVASSLSHLASLSTVDVSTIAEKLRQAKDGLMKEAFYRKFAWIAPDRSVFLDQGSLFGIDVGRAFPSASFDIIEAGNCLSVECSTASVFHLMRVAEHGLRALAFDRRIKLPKNKPIDLATWEDLLQQLDTAETQIQGWPKTHAREAQFEFVHGALMEVKRFKNVFRNRVMHSRESYDRNQALSAFEHVKEFMKILSSRISEGKRTPLRWKGSQLVTA